MHFETFESLISPTYKLETRMEGHRCVYVGYHMAYLVSELIAGNTQDNKPLVCIATVELVHLSVVPGCCSSE